MVCADIDNQRLSRNIQKSLNVSLVLINIESNKADILSHSRHLIEDGVLQGGCLCTYVEIPKELSIEIDTTLDLAFAEQVLLHLGLEPITNNPKKQEA